MIDLLHHVDALKLQCIQEFIKYCKSLQKGYANKKYNGILNLICFINYYKYLENPKALAQYLIDDPVFLYKASDNANLLNEDNRIQITNQRIPLFRNNFLAEYKSELDKKKVLANLGVDWDNLEWTDIQ